MTKSPVELIAVREKNTAGRRSRSTTSSSARMRLSHADYTFNPASEKWLLANGVGVDIQRLRERVTGQLEPGLINTLAHYAETRTARSVNNICLELHNYFNFLMQYGKVVVELRPQDLLNYRALMFEQDAHDSRVGKLRPFFRKWRGLGYHGVSEDMFNLLVTMNLKASPQGRAVLSLHPEDGPLEPAESASLRAGVMSAYERGLVTHEGLLVSLLLSYSGRRPIQIAHLKLMDLDDSRTDDVHSMALDRAPRKLLLLHIPRAKQRDSKFRQLRRSLEVIPALWAALVKQREAVLGQFDVLLLERKLMFDQTDREEIHRHLPLIPSWSRIRTSLAEIVKLESKRLYRERLAKLGAAATSDLWHRPSAKMLHLVAESSTAAGVTGRTGTPLKVNPRRMRYAKGTDAARAGYGKQVIAELLDHTTTHTVDLYTRTVPEHAAPINRAMAVAMAPLVQLFRGQLVDRETHANGGDNPLATRILFKGIGTATCGTGVQCGLNRLPRPCYTCDSFQPWLEGPHEAILEELLRERQQRLDILGHPRMVGIEDDTIIAVVNVIQRCQARRAERGELAGKTGHMSAVSKRRTGSKGKRT